MVTVRGMLLRRETLSMDLLALTLAVICTNDLVNNERRHFALFCEESLIELGIESAFICVIRT